MNDHMYPIGQFTLEKSPSTDQVNQWIKEIEETPILLREAVKPLTDDQLDTPYRTGGWTVRQVVHHLADSHMNSYIRFKLALTEDFPAIKPYDQEMWAELPDSQLPIEVSLMLLEGLHNRWVTILRSLQPNDLDKGFKHPEMGNVKLSFAICLYAWHGQHHIAHITRLRKRLGW